MNAVAVQLVAPKKVELRSVALPTLEPGSLLVRSEASALSAGTERLVSSGQLEPGVALDESIGALAEVPKYPFSYGYCSVGTVEAVGSEVPSWWVGARVFAFHPHQSRFVISAAEVVRLPESIDPVDATFLANIETAVSLVMDAAPILGEVTVVVGLGVVGQLVLGICTRLGLGRVIGVDPRSDRRSVASQFAPGAEVVAATSTDVADVVIEVSGNPSALEQAFSIVRREGRIIVGSWFGGTGGVRLGARAHRNRNTVRFSQVSQLDPALAARFDKSRRMSLALDWLGRLPVRSLVTHRVPFVEAPRAWALLHEAPAGCLQVVLQHERS